MNNRPEQSPLGCAVVYRDTYAPDLLYPIPRQSKRDELGIVADALPFAGEDMWNAYEISWLGPRGKPVVALGVFRIPCDSPYLIESKSLKLYLNSFNQQVFADADAVCRTVNADLEKACGAAVKIQIHPLSSRPDRDIRYPEGVLLDTLDIDIDCYQTNPSFLQTVAGAEVSETLYSHLLKSNCLVTGQPDWGMVAVRYAGMPMDRAGLLRYIVSFRGHNEFHEQCVERIFCDILEHCRPRDLTVWARYTRRGGLDINPFRTTGPFSASDNVFEVRQ